MKNFRKNIYRQNSIENSPEPPYHLYNTLQGDFNCFEGFINITNTSPLVVYTPNLITEWDIGTTLYSDEAMTIPVTATYIKSVPEGIINLFYIDLIDGIIVDKYEPNTPC